MFSTVPDALFPMLCQKSTQIVIGELLAVRFAFGCFLDLLRNASAIAFVDNMVVFHISVNGAARTRAAQFIKQPYHILFSLLPSSPAVLRIHTYGGDFGWRCLQGASGSLV